MNKQVKTKSTTAIIDLLILLLMTLFPVIIYLFFEQQWRELNKSPQISFAVKFFIQSFLSFSLAGIGFVTVMIFRKEKFIEFGLVKKGALVSILLSIVAFIPHFIFLMVSKGFHGYMPMSGAIIFDSVMEQQLFVKIFCMIIVYFLWGFCEGFNYVFISQKLNIIFPNKRKFLNIGALVCGFLCVMLHGGISFNMIAIFDALTMFVFVYGILLIKDINNNSWGCIFAFLFLWNAFP